MLDEYTKPASPNPASMYYSPLQDNEAQVMPEDGVYSTDTEYRILGPAKPGEKPDPITYVGFSYTINLCPMTNETKHDTLFNYSWMVIKHSLCKIKYAYGCSIELCWFSG